MGSGTVRREVAVGEDSIGGVSEIVDSEDTSWHRLDDGTGDVVEGGDCVNSISG